MSADQLHYTEDKPEEQNLQETRTALYISEIIYMISECDELETERLEL